MAPARPADDSADRELIQFLLAEHSLMQSTLQTSIIETGSRLTSFLAAVSGSVVALAFVGQVSGFTEPFTAFALVLLPALLFLGLVSFERVLQLFLQETMCYRGMNRIRRFFTERLPAATSVITLSTFDDLTGVSRTGGSYRPEPGADPKTDPHQRPWHDCGARRDPVWGDHRAHRRSTAAQPMARDHHRMGRGPRPRRSPSLARAAGVWQHVSSRSGAVPCPRHRRRYAELAATPGAH